MYRLSRERLIKTDKPNNVCAMVGVNLWHTRHRHMRISTLLHRMGIKPIAHYLDENFLGHIDRLAKQVLGVYSTEKWARGRPQEHTRHRLRTALNARMKLIDPPLGQGPSTTTMPDPTQASTAKTTSPRDYVERDPLVRRRKGPRVEGSVEEDHQARSIYDVEGLAWYS